MTKSEMLHGLAIDRAEAAVVRAAKRWKHERDSWLAGSRVSPGVALYVKLTKATGSLDRSVARLEKLEGK